MSKKFFISAAGLLLLYILLLSAPGADRGSSALFAANPPAAEKAAGHTHGGHDHSNCTHGGHDHGNCTHGGHDHGNCTHGGHDHGNCTHGGHDHGNCTHGGHDHGNCTHGGHDHTQAPGSHGYEGQTGNLHDHFHDESAQVSHDVYFGEPWRISGSVSWMQKKALWLAAFSLAVWIFLKIRKAPRRKKEAQ